MRRLRPVFAAIVVLCISSCAVQPNAPVGLKTVGSFLPGTASAPSSTAQALTSSTQSEPTAVLSSQTPPTTPRTSMTTAARGTVTGWIENFDGAAGSPPDPTLLQYRLGGNGWGNKEVESYTDHPQNASLDGKGDLVIRAVREQYKGTDGITRQWTSARLDSLDKWAFTTGTIAIRMKVPAGVGLWPAFWLEGTAVGTVGWPKAGEIDVVETLTKFNGVYQTVHGPNGTAAGYSYSANTPAPAGTSVASGFHVFSVTRSPGKIEFGIDGKLSGTITPKVLKKKEAWAFDKPMFMIVNLAVGGWSGLPTAQTSESSALLVDWIRYYPEVVTQ